MTIEDESVEFLQNHIDTSFSGLMNEFVIEEVEWLEADEIRPIAPMKDNKGNKSNLICLFPPFIPTEEIK